MLPAVLQHNDITRAVTTLALVKSDRPAGIIHRVCAQVKAFEDEATYQNKKNIALCLELARQCDELGGVDLNFDDVVLRTVKMSNPSAEDLAAARNDVRECPYSYIRCLFSEIHIQVNPRFDAYVDLILSVRDADGRCFVVEHMKLVCAGVVNVVGGAVQLIADTFYRMMLLRYINAVEAVAPSAQSAAYKSKVMSQVAVEAELLSDRLDAKEFLDNRDRDIGGEQWVAEYI